MTGYWIGRIKVTDPDAYAEYVRRVPAILEAYGGRFLVRGGRAVSVEGEDWPRNVVIAFPSFEQAKACYHSAEYQEAKALQDAAAVRMIAIVDGV